MYSTTHTHDKGFYSAFLFLIVLMMVIFLLPNNSIGQMNIQTPQQSQPNQNFMPNTFPINQSVPPGSQIDNQQYYGQNVVPPMPQQMAQQPSSAFSMAPADLELTARVREELSSNRNLSQAAQNISVTSQNGKVILQGTVINEYERTTVISLAERAAGSQQVFSQLRVQ